jgi:hypothetical protein
MLTVLTAGLAQPPSAVTLVRATLREDEDTEGKYFQKFSGFIPA